MALLWVMCGEESVCLCGVWGCWRWEEISWYGGGFWSECRGLRGGLGTDWGYCVKYLILENLVVKFIVRIFGGFYNNPLLWQEYI